MASYDKSYSKEYTSAVQNVLQGMGANLGRGGVDGKWGAYTQAAYDKYRPQVEAALGKQSGGTWTGMRDDMGGGIPGGAPGSSYGGFSYKGGVNASYSPISYKGRTLDELMAEAQGLIGGEYDAQLRTNKDGYELSQKNLAQSYEGTRKNTQDSAVARGMGRSSYLTDAIANVGLKETAANADLTGRYNAAVTQLEKSRAEAISAYVQQLQRQQEERAFQAEMFNREMQYKYDALAAQQAAAMWGGSGSGGGKGGHHRGGPSTEPTNPNPAETTSYVDSELYKVAKRIQEQNAQYNMQWLQRQSNGEEYARYLMKHGNMNQGQKVTYTPKKQYSR